MSGSADVVLYDQNGLHGDELRSLIVSTVPARVWEPLDLKRILQLYREAGNATNLKAFIDQHLRNDNEKGLVIYLDSLRKGSYATVQLYARYIVGLLNHSRKDFHTINYLDIRDYLNSFIADTKKNTTVNVVLAAMKGFYKMMHGSGAVPQNPLALVKVKKIPKSERVVRTVKKAVPENELTEQRKYLREKAPLRNLAMVAVMSTMGLRGEEICTLDCGDISYDSTHKAHVLTVYGKGSKHRILKIPAPTLNLLKHYLQFEYLITGDEIPVAMRELPLFPALQNKSHRLTRQAVYRMVTRLCQRAGLPHRSPHGYRHYFLTKGAQHKVSLEELMRAAGHEDLSTTLIYVEAEKIFSNQVAEIFDDEDLFISK